MATLTFNDQLTVLDQANLLGPDGGILTMAEILDEENEVIQDAIAKMANGIRANVTAVRTDLPQIFPRKINEGATTKYPMSKQTEDQIMLLEAHPEIDEQLVIPYPDQDRARATQLVPFLEAFSQAFVENLFYGNRGDIGEINGLSTVYNTLTAPAAASGNVWGAGGTGSDTMSLWMIEWHESKMSLIYPKGSPSVGLFNKDLGHGKAYKDGKPFMAFSNQMKMEFGWSNPDTRAVQRLANIEVSGSTNNIIAASVVQSIVRMRGRLPKRGKGKTAIYGNREALSQFDIWAMDKANGFYYQHNISGGPLLVFQGMPVRLAERLLSTETAIS